MVDFSQQVVIVTGAGRGLGRLFALDFARRGACVVVNDLGSSMGGEGADGRIADSVVEEIERAGGVAVASHDSVATAAGSNAIVQCAMDNYGRVDAVVSNAGIFSTIAFEDLSGDDWRQMQSVHLDGSFYLSQSAYRIMKEQGYGRLVFISSSAGMFGQPMEAHYAAAKAGIVGLSNVIAIEGEPYGILSNCVLPFGFSRMAAVTSGEPSREEASIPFVRALVPELVVPLVVYLASHSCSVTHHNYSACAGRFARVFVGLAAGWVAENESQLAAEDIAAHFPEISETTPFIVPDSIFEEVAAVCARLDIEF